MLQELHSLQKLCNQIHPLNDEEWAAFSRPWVHYSANRKQVITSPGEIERYLYFIVSGIQRVYYFDDSGREATLVFTYPPSFGGVVDSLMLQQPSAYYYEALDPSEFMRVPYTELNILMNGHHGIESLIRKGISAALTGVLERLKELQCFSSEEKFRILLKRSPHILQLVPHKYLANYIGIDPTNFSKLLNKVKI